MLRMIIAVLTARLILMLCRLNHTGWTAMPGILAKNICPDILQRTSASVSTIMVTGSNGKSTTVRMLYDMLKINGVDCFANTEGANEDIGIIAAFVRKAVFSEKQKITWPS